MKAAASLLLVFLGNGLSLSAVEIYHAQGEMAGEPTATSILLQSRLTAISGPDLKDGDLPGALGVACFEWDDSPDFVDAQRTSWIEALPGNDFIVRAKLEDLKPGTSYHYRLVFGGTSEQTQSGPVRRFKTLPAADATDTTAPLSFIMGSCQNYAFFMHGRNGKGGMASAEDKRLGFPAYQAMLALEPDFFIGSGDIVYYDHFAKTAAQTLPELRKKWHEQFRFPRLIEFFASTPAYWSKDDHDFRFNDADLAGERLPSPVTGIEIFREQMPIHSAGDLETPTYRTHRVHHHLQLWFVEGRDYRSPNKMEDGPDKTIWGRRQRDWLQGTLQASNATWKVIITPTPMVGPDRNSKKDNHTNLAGFKHEADSFFQWLRENRLANVLTFCGDRHWQYHSIHPLGVEEFSVGALNDENAIAGEKPGGKHTTDPAGLIRQPFLYPEPTGGFLHVTVSGENDAPQLRLRFYDDEGASAYEVVRRPGEPIE